MDPIKCTWCDAVGTPSTMRWACVLDEIPHPESEYTVPWGPVCAKCAPEDADTMQDADENSAPTEADLEAAVAMLEGDEVFDREVAALVEVAEQDAALEGRELTDDERMQRAVVAAWAWWEGCDLNWSTSLSPEGRCYLVPTTTTKEA